MLKQQELAARRARAEAREARTMFGRAPPVGNPYRVAPIWCPFWLAKIIAQIKGMPIKHG